MSELKAIRSGEIYNIIEYEDCYRTDDLYYPKSEVDAAIAEFKDENRRLKRALYKACANWANVVAFEETEGIGHDNSVAERWRKMESKCLKKAKEYK